MTTTLQDLCSLPPSGRSRPLLLDLDAYAHSVVRQGAKVPWDNVAELALYLGQVQALLRPDALWVDIEAFFESRLAERGDLVTEMGSRTRTGYPLKTLLSDEDLLAELDVILTTLAESTKRKLVLNIASPARWLGRAHSLAGNPLEEIESVRADAASMYIAEWIGKFGKANVAALIMDGREKEGDAPLENAEELGEYTSIINVVGHFSWSCALRDQTGVATTETDVDVEILDETFWASGDAPEGGSGVVLSHIPADSDPETVLVQLAKLD